MDDHNGKPASGSALPDEPIQDPDGPREPVSVGWDTGVQWESVAATTAPPPRPRLPVMSTAGRVIDLYLSHPATFIVLVLPSAIIGVLLNLVTGPGTSGAVFLVLFVGVFVVAIASGLATIIAADELRAGRPVHYRDVVRRAVRRTVTALLSGLAQYIAIVGLAIAASIPAVIAVIAKSPAAVVVTTLLAIILIAYVLLRWSLSSPAMALEQTGPLQALGRSRALTKGTVWRILGVFFLVALLILPLSIGLTILVLSGIDPPLGTALSGAAGLVSAPLFSITSMFVFVELSGRGGEPVAVTPHPRRVPVAAGLLMVGIATLAIAIPNMGKAFERLTIQSVPVADRGVIRAGTARNPLDLCQPVAVATTFRSTDAIYIGGYFTKAIQSGETATVEFYLNGTLANSVPLAAPATAVNCYIERDPIVGAQSGTYRLVVRFKGEVIADGTFVIQ